MPSEEMEALYKSGKSLRQIAEIAGITNTTVRKRLLALGVELRRRGDPWSSTLAPQVRDRAERRADEKKLKAEKREKERQGRNRLIATVGRLRQAGLTYEEIAAETGKTYTQISIIIRRHVLPEQSR